MWQTVKIVVNFQRILSDPRSLFICSKWLWSIFSFWFKWNISTRSLCSRVNYTSCHCSCAPGSAATAKTILNSVTVTWESRQQSWEEAVGPTHKHGVPVCIFNNLGSFFLFFFFCFSPRTKGNRLNVLCRALFASLQKKRFPFLQISDAGKTYGLEEAYLLRCLLEGVMIAME